MIVVPSGIGIGEGWQQKITQCYGDEAWHGNDGQYIAVELSIGAYHGGGCCRTKPQHHNDRLHEIGKGANEAASCHRYGYHQHLIKLTAVQIAEQPRNPGKGSFLSAQGDEHKQSAAGLTNTDRQHRNTGHGDCVGKGVQVEYHKQKQDAAALFKQLGGGCLHVVLQTEQISFQDTGQRYQWNQRYDGIQDGQNFLLLEDVGCQKGEYEQKGQNNDSVIQQGQNHTDL